MAIATRLFITLFVASVLLVPPREARAEAKVMIDGIGAAKCSQVTTEIKTQRATVTHSLLGWTYGYITRRNVERALAKQSQVDMPALKVGDQQLLSVMLSFCEKEPDTYIFQVVDALYQVLLEKGALTT